MRRLDPTRLVDAASGWFDQGGGDLRSRHRYVLRLRRAPRRDRRPYYLSEFGGLNLAVPGHAWEQEIQFGYGFSSDAEELAQALTRLYREQLIPPGRPRSGGLHLHTGQRRRAGDERAHDLRPPGDEGRALAHGPAQRRARSGLPGGAGLS